MVKRFDVYLVNLDEVSSKDAKNTRPCVILSPDEMNGNIAHVIVAPLSSGKARYPTRVAIDFLNSERFVVLDQLRAVDRARLVKKIGEIDKETHGVILDRLGELFAA
ncbi:MAG TPA: type II toxin-antitoxin system PemK/MazF family toxin [Pyrinomonadaceae bacterium]|nr:type II toxin-antitoxin system PemK/MazF family toxin [Pyrinomonadaceae bacterium]